MLDSDSVLLKVFEASNEEELLQKDLRIQDGDVRCAANEGVCCVGQGMNDIIPD